VRAHGLRTPTVSEPIEYPNPQSTETEQSSAMRNTQRMNRPDFDRQGAVSSPILGWEQNCSHAGDDRPVAGAATIRSWC
jgi:hypothetical protein